MTPDAAAVAIETTIAAAAIVPATSVAWPNVAFTPPATGSWLKVDIVWGAGFVITKDGRNAVVGLLQLALFAPKDGGDGALSALAETARAIFNRKRLSTDVVFDAVSGPKPMFEESWRSLILSAPFQVYETVP